MATVVAGAWQFGYGMHFDENSLKTLPPGSVYSEPVGVNHFARTTNDPAILHISGYSPTDTRYFESKNDLRLQEKKWFCFAWPHILRRYCCDGSCSVAPDEQPCHERAEERQRRADHHDFAEPRNEWLINRPTHCWSDCRIEVGRYDGASQFDTLVIERALDVRWDPKVEQALIEAVIESLQHDKSESGDGDQARELEMARLCDEGAEPIPKRREPNRGSFGSPERERFERFKEQLERESLPVELIQPPQEPQQPTPVPELPQKALDAENAHDVPEVTPPALPAAPPAAPQTAQPNLGQLLRGELGPADWWYANRPNKLVAPTKSEDEPIRHASFCTFQCGGGCICDAGRGKHKQPDACERLVGKAA